VLALHRAVVAVDLDLLVDADRRHLPLGVFVVLLQKRTQGRLVHLGEGAGAAAGRLWKGRWFKSVSSVRSDRFIG
jgi:hypothetical protein